MLKYLLPAILMLALLAAGTVLAIAVTCGFGEEPPPDITIFTDSGQLLGESNSHTPALGDLDGDGDLDAFVTNVAEANQVWINDGSGTFNPGDVVFDISRSWRVALGDLDNDADIDIVLNHWNDSCVVLQNNTTSSGHWLRVQLTGTQSNRDAIGTAIRVVTKNNTLLYQRKSAGSYLSSHDARIFVGLGSVDQIERLEITWPRGMIQSFENIEVDRTYRITEGQTLSPIP